jgi:hypothetical protein
MGDDPWFCESQARDAEAGEGRPDGEAAGTGAPRTRAQGEGGEESGAGVKCERCGNAEGIEPLKVVADSGLGGQVTKYKRIKLSCGHERSDYYGDETHMDCQECPTATGLEKISMSGGKRANLAHSKNLDDWWVGTGKDESCQFEGPWEHMVILAARILSHPNTQKVAPNLYLPNIQLTKEQEETY